MTKNNRIRFSERKYIKNQSNAIADERLAGNRARYDTRHMLTNQMKNIFGFVPEGYRFAA